MKYLSEETHTYTFNSSTGVITVNCSASIVEDGVITEHEETVTDDRIPADVDSSVLNDISSALFNVWLSGKLED